MERQALVSGTIPSLNLVTLDLLYGDPLEPQASVELNALLVSSRNLEKLHMLAGLHFSATCGRLPPIKALQLERQWVLTPEQDWPYTSEQVAQIWDFSRLNDLDLSYLDTGLFAKTVPAGSLLALRKLCILQARARYVATKQVMLSTDIANFIEDVPRLEELNITCHFPRNIVRVLPCQKGLRKLLLCNSREYGVYSENGNDFYDSSEDRWIGPEEIRQILMACPLLTQLSLNFKIQGEDGSRKVISSLALIRSLSAYVKSLGPPKLCVRLRRHIILFQEPPKP